MIFKVNSTIDERTQKAYDEAMESLNDFWGIDWTSMTPNIFVVDSRKDMDMLKGKSTEPWMVAFATGNQPGDRKVYILDYDKFATESSWQITEEGYKALLKHEICHLFTTIVSKGRQIPSWLNEGLSICLSGQLSLGRVKPTSFGRFLSGNIKDSYDEGGFVVEILINKFGKDKLIKLIGSMSEVKSQEDSQKIFKDVFGIDLSYDSINNIDKV